MDRCVALDKEIREWFIAKETSTSLQDFTSLMFHVLWNTWYLYIPFFFPWIFVKEFV